ncbi:YkvI family membrane protein [Anaerosalibacter sp. Marseille-P3206]|uniref:YkvI family membrane protein n=1 Tax=Anaerosalibacter sp. Marseille-P3206 TaxID=1871005 RepID=UPI0009866D24|nr:hypothetical protein [Anaerosalibacter sp. Marseille-P3206]
MDRNLVKIAFIYIGTVIGAGFASGREIIDFFGVYGLKGILGMIISGCLFAFIGAFFLSKVYELNIQNNNELLNLIFGKKLSIIIETIIAIYLFVGFSIMLSGSGAILSEEFNLPIDFGIYLMSILCFVVFIFSIKGLSFINTLLVPILIIGIIFLSSNVILKEGLVFSNTQGASITNKGNFITSSILYVSFNSLLMIVVLSSLLPIIPNKSTAIRGGIVGGLSLGLIGCFILMPLLILYTETYNIEIPMLKVSEYVSIYYRKVFNIVLWFAMFTTAIANGYGFIENRFKNINRIVLSFVFCLCGIPVSKLGFSSLVSTMYPIFGYIGGAILIISLLRLS